ncbi:MAG: NUDIX hydrolase [Lachnospiraceae bacterium]|nr:NUDIX hydrolase [Lachnospiraceae bacterium]
MPDKVERIGRNLIHKGNIVEIYEDMMRLPDGREETYDFIRHKGAAAVIPVLPDGRILMVRQYRNALDAYTLEIPAGGRNSETEPTLECAYRELEEETGYHAERSDITFLLTLYTTVAFCNEKIDIYVARNMQKTAQHLDDDEYINVEAYTIEELTNKVYSGEIVDAKTIAGLMTYRVHMEEGQRQ